MGENDMAAQAKRIFYRVKFSRGHEVRYVAHLDILRLFDRAARRGNVPLGYSKGFNPHPLIVFGMPLPVGVTSEAEYADIELIEDIGGEELLKRFNEAMPPSVKLLEYERININTPNIMKAVVASEYRVDVQFENETVHSASLKMNEYLASHDVLIAEKRTKSGTKETDIRGMIIKIEPECDKSFGENSLRVTTAAGNAVNLRPELAIISICDKLNMSVTVGHIHRLSLIREQGV